MQCFEQASNIGLSVDSSSIKETKIRGPKKCLEKVEESSHVDHLCHVRRRHSVEDVEDPTD